MLCTSFRIITPNLTSTAPMPLHSLFPFLVSYPLSPLSSSYTYLDFAKSTSAKGFCKLVKDPRFHEDHLPSLLLVFFLVFCCLCMASLQLSALQEKKLNPNAEPYVYLHKSLISPNPYGALSPYYPSQLCYHLAHFQSSIYRNYWCGLPYTPLGRLAACIPPSTNSTCRSDFHGQKAIIKPKSTVTAPKVEKEPWKPKTHRVLRRRCFPCRFEARKAPIPKPKVQPKDESSLTFDDPDTESGRTTVMIKNIPGRFTRKMILELLDNHCKEENEKAASSPPSEYDFLYLPIDFRQKLNLGYAFVNFTTSRAAQMFYKSMNNFKWVSFGSKKVCEITYAAIQGKDALVMHFKNKNFKCNSEMYLPVLLSPARNGSTSRPFPTVVGNRRAPFVNTKGHEERFHSPSL